MLRKLPISFHYCKNNEKLFLLRFYYASTTPPLRLHYVEQHVYVTPDCGFPTHPPV